MRRRSPRATPSRSCSRAAVPRPGSSAWRTDGRARRTDESLRGRTRGARADRAAAREGGAAARRLARGLRARRDARAGALRAARAGGAAGRGAAPLRCGEAPAPPRARQRGVTMDLARYLATRSRLVERDLAARFPPVRTRLRQAIRYSLLAGGKRIRPI